MSKPIDVSFYEDTDFSDLMKTTKPVKVHGNVKRITINLSSQAVEEAQKLDASLNMGYQNVLKAAIPLGLKELRETVKVGA